MSYLPAILTVALAHLLAAMSPGPDFVLITRNSLVYSKRSGIYTALGLGLGICVHVTYSLVGIGLIIAKSVLLFSILKLIGAGYLIYIGYRALRAPHQDLAMANPQGEIHLNARKAVRMGFLTNVTNPKVTLFFLSLFTVVIDPATPLYIKFIMGGEMAIATFLWFALVATIVSHQAVKTRFQNIQHYAEKTMGVLLIALGIRLAFSSSK